MLEFYIKEAAKQAGFEKYSLKNGIFTQPNWSAGLKVHDDIIIVTEFVALCSIPAISDLTTKNVAILESPGRKIDYKHMIKFNEVAGAIQLSSDFISVHSTILEVDVTNPVWDSIYSGHFKYILLRREK